MSFHSARGDGEILDAPLLETRRKLRGRQLEDVAGAPGDDISLPALQIAVAALSCPARASAIARAREGFSAMNRRTAHPVR